MTDIRAALRDLVALLDHYPLGTFWGGDWACPECHPDSDMLVLGWQCALHRARAALAAASPEHHANAGHVGAAHGGTSPEPKEHIDRWGDKGPCGFVLPSGAMCLIERYRHPNVVVIGHRWKKSPAPTADALVDDRR